MHANSLRAPEFGTLSYIQMREQPVRARQREKKASLGMAVSGGVKNLVAVIGRARLWLQDCAPRTYPKRTLGLCRKGAVQVAVIATCTDSCY